MVKSLIMANRSTVFQLVDNLTEEQMNDILSKAHGILSMLECEEDAAEPEYDRTE